MHKLQGNQRKSGSKGGRWLFLSLMAGERGWGQGLMGGEGSPFCRWDEYMQLLPSALKAEITLIVLMTNRERVQTRIFVNSFVNCHPDF